MGGQQIPSIGKIIYVEMSYLQLPAAARKCSNFTSINTFDYMDNDQND